MRTVSRWSALFIVLCLLFSFAFAYAQDPTEEPTAEPTADMTAEPTSEATAEVPPAETTPDPSAGGTTSGMGTVACDSDLILNLYIAERFFNFGALQMDTSAIDKGQFAPWFDNLAASTTLSDEQMNMMSGLMTLDEATLSEQMSGGMDMSGMTALNPASLPDEAPECSTLRAQLYRFFNIIAFQDFSTSTGDSGLIGAEATASADMGENVNYSAVLAGTNEVPEPGDPDGTGTAAVTIDSANGQICYNITVQNITLPAQAAHIHRGAAGEAGDVVVPFDLAPDANGVASGCVLVDAALLSEIAENPLGFYVNVHTTDFPNGAVRGQVAG